MTHLKKYMNKFYDSIEALLPLRGGSKGIVRKNLKIFNNFPLFYWTAKAIIESKVKLNISSEDLEIKKSAKNFFPNINIIDRPAVIAQDSSSTEEVIQHFLDSNDCEHVLLIQATSPLVKSCEINKALQNYYDNNCRPLVSGTLQRRFIWDEKGYPKNYDPFNRPRRQEWEGDFVENGALYIFSRKDFLKNHSRCNPPCTLFIMDEVHHYEIDSELDWMILENIMKNSF